MRNAGPAVVAHIELNRTHLTNEEERNGPPQSAPKSHLFRTGPAALARNTVFESTFEVGRRFRCTMRVDCGRLDPGAVIRPDLANGIHARPSSEYFVREAKFDYDTAPRS